MEFFRQNSKRYFLISFSVGRIESKHSLNWNWVRTAGKKEHYTSGRTLAPFESIPKTSGPKDWWRKSSKSLAQSRFRFLEPQTMLSINGRRSLILDGSLSCGVSSQIAASMELPLRHLNNKCSVLHDVAISHHSLLGLDVFLISDDYWGLFRVKKGINMLKSQ